MFHYHFLNEEQHTEFLSQNRKDPITGDKILEGDCIVICAACKSAFLEESWEYLRQQHCNQYSTLNKIPKTEKIYFNDEPLVFLPFGVRNEESFFNEFICKFLQSSTTVFLSLLPLVFIILVWYFIPSIDGQGYTVILNALIMPIGSLIFYISVVRSSSKPTTFLGQMMMQKSRFFIQLFRQSYARENYFAINLKNKSIVSKTELGEREVSFSAIEKIIHTYYPDKIINKNGYLLLRIRITTNKEIISYESIFKETEAPQLNTFLNNLPQNLKIFGRSYVTQYY